MSAPLARRPFAEQCALIDAAIGDVAARPALLAELGRLPDPAPLAYAVEALAARGALDAGCGLAEVLASVGDAHLGRALRGLPEGLPAAARAALIDRVVAALDRLEAERVAAACFLLRWIGKADPARGAALAEAAVAEARGAAAGDPGAIDDRALLRVPGRAYGALARAAADPARWAARMRRFAAATLDALEAQPKSLSQVGAEALLSRRVYTDPTHFVMELIQNAEDADASRWHLSVWPDRLEVEHDGVPFDARDVVGVLSIGQTTKGGDRIGFFGVGFKSVYAVTDRPRVRSGPFDFEIADVSLPHRLEGDGAGESTRLTLPLRAPDDAAVGHGAIGRRALALPATLLLTLRHIGRLRIEVGGRVRAVSRRAVGEEVELRDGDRVSRWWVVDGADDPMADAIARSVRVAVALDADGMPIPVPSGEPTVFCFLPTRDRPGLAVLVHARFALPVDRERVDLDAPASGAALRHAGRLLARLADGWGATPARLWRLIGLLPRPETVRPAEWGAIFEGFAAASAGRALLPTADGSRVAAERARAQAPGALADALAGVALADGRRVVSPPDAAAAASVAALGVPALTGADLVALLRATLREDGIDGSGGIDGSDGITPPGWLARGAAAVLGALAEVPALTGLATGLARVPVVPDARGRWHPAVVAGRAPARLRALFPHRALLDPALDTPTLAPLWRALEVPTLSDDDVAADLRDPRWGETMRAVGAERLLAWMAEQPASRLAGLEAVPLVPDERGAIRPIGAPGGAFVADDGPLGAWAEAWPDARPAMVEAGLRRRFGEVLRRMGAPVLGIGALLEAGDAIDGPALAALHRALDAMAPDLTPRRAARLAAAAIFPDVHGARRPLRGPESAIRPARPDLPALLPDGPWLDPALHGARHVALIDPPTVGPADVARALADADSPLSAPVGSPRWRRLAAWVVAHAPPIDAALRARLAAAPIWSSGAGFAALDALRTPPDRPAWAALYAAWDRWAAPDAEAVALAEALGLGARVAPVGGRRVVADLVAEPLPEGARALLGPALAALGEALPGEALAPLAGWAMHPDAAGARRPLALSWAAADEGGAHRASGAIRAALAAGRRALLDAGWQAQIAPLLDALGVEAASIRSLLPFAERDPAFAAPETRAVVRAALAADPAAVGALDAVDRERVAALAIWPTAAGGFAAARALCPPEAGRRLPVEVLAGLDAEARLAEGALAEAERLSAHVGFRALGALLAERVEAEARVGEPLAAQPGWLARPGAVARVRAAIAEDGGGVEGLPLWVDLGRRLVAGPLYTAGPDGRALAAVTALAARVAHPEDDAPPRPLPARVLLAALADAVEAGPVAGHPVLGDGALRAALYRWVEGAAAEIDGDDQARGQLGRAAIWPTSGGALRTARALLPLDPEDPLARAARRDPALDWTPAEEIPAALRARLRGWFALDARRLRTAVEHIVEAHRQVGDDVARSAALVDLLAGLLRRSAGDLAELVARFKLHRALKVADAEGVFDRPRSLLAPRDPAHGALIAAFHPDPPRRPHPMYGAEALALLRAAGAAGDLDDGALVEALDRPAAGLDAALARARYVAERAAADPALVERLGLGRRPWLIDAAGVACSPAEVDWPDAALDALIGPEGGRRPHPAVVHAVPPALVARLPVRTAADADPRAVAARLVEGEPIEVGALRWFDDALLERRITPEAARAALAGRRVFADDAGRCRTAGELVRDLEPGRLGRRRGGFGEGRAVPRLLGALGIPAEVTPAVLEGWLAEVAAAWRRDAGLLAVEPELIEAVPRAVAELAGARPAVVLARGPEGARLCGLDDARLAWPTPPELAESARRAGAPVRLVMWAGAEGAPARWGVATVADRWAPTPERAPRGEALPGLAGTLGALWSVLPRLGFGDAGPVPAARRVADADRPGRIEGVAVPWPRAARVAEGPTVLVRDPADGAAIAEALVRDLLVGGPDAEVEARIGRLLACGHAAAMGLLLDAEGVARSAGASVSSREVPRAVGIERAEREGAPEGERASVAEGPELERSEPERPDLERPEEAPETPDPGLLGRLKRWWRGDEEPEPRDAPRESPRESPPRAPREQAPRPGGGRRSPDDDPGFRPPDTTRFFQPQRAVEPQLRADPNWLATRQTPSEIGFGFAPGRLSGVHQYGPALIADRFDPRGGRWTASGVVDPRWGEAAPGGGFRVAFTGRLPTGEAGLAVPLFGRVLDLEADGRVRRATARDGRPILIAPGPTDVRYTVELTAAPPFADEAPPAVAPLLAPTVPDGELPAECHDLVEHLLGAPPRARVAGVGQFVRREYRYDPSYLEDPAHARWLRRVTRGRANAHVAALHAGRDGRHLGAGVCYELNALVCELLRRAGVPAAIATGWTFDRGWIDQPDHLWAMALLTTPAGPRWLPVDASTTVDGRPLHATPRPPGPHRPRPPRQDRPEPPAVAWSDAAAPRSSEAAPLRDLLRVIRHAERLGAAPKRSEAERLAAARRLLTDPAQARALLALVEAAGDGAGE